MGADERRNLAVESANDIGYKGITFAVRTVACPHFSFFAILLQRGTVHLFSAKATAKSTAIHFTFDRLEKKLVRTVFARQ